MGADGVRYMQPFDGFFPRGITDRDMKEQKNAVDSYALTRREADMLAVK